MLLKFTLFMLIIIQIGCNRGSAVSQDHGDANAYMHQTPTEDLIRHFESPERDAYQKPELVLEYLGDLQNKKIMDIGAGSGYFSFRLAQAGANVIAADVDDDFQKSIQDKMKLDGMDQLEIELRKLPYDSPKLQPGEVEMVFMANTYHHIENRVDYLKKVMSGLAEDGELVIIDFFKKSQSIGPPPDHKIALVKVLEELKEAGFTNVETNVELLKYQYIVRAKITS